MENTKPSAITPLIGVLVNSARIRQSSVTSALNTYFRVTKRKTIIAAGIRSSDQ